MVASTGVRATDAPALRAPNTWPTLLSTAIIFRKTRWCKKSAQQLPAGNIEYLPGADYDGYRTSAARSDHRAVPLDECQRVKSGHVRKHLGPSWRHHADFTVSDALRRADPRHDRRDAHRWRLRFVDGTAQALYRMALSPRHHEGAARGWRHRPYGIRPIPRFSPSPARRFRRAIT